MEMNALEQFSLMSYLRADLMRARHLLYGPSQVDPGIRLWIGLLSPRFFPVALCRLAHYFFCHKLFGVAKFISFVNYVFFGIEIAVRCPIGPGLFFPHTQGTVIGAWSIGSNATIFQGVTLGAKELDFSYLENSRPVICNDVTIGSGAKVLGGIRINNGVRIGANAVVLQSFDCGVVAVGIPAQVAPLKGHRAS
ncbi:serine O-acetyltransferase [Polynucleobacter sp.]|jgi:serine O-acetyltransferase|uniref:serine O-acetyltransferase n=1 Tax=Polynucleobacter sp. TaxID=2029855 RepID=UPI0037C8FDAE